MIDRCHRIEPRLGTPEEILLKHTQEQYDVMKSTDKQKDTEKLEELSSHYDAVFFHPVSVLPNILALISIFNACEYVMRWYFFFSNEL